MITSGRRQPIVRIAFGCLLSWAAAEAFSTRMRSVLATAGWTVCGAFSNKNMGSCVLVCGRVLQRGQVKNGMAAAGHSQRRAVKAEGFTRQVHRPRRHVEGEPQHCHLPEGKENWRVSLFTDVEHCPWWWISRELHEARLGHIGCISRLQA